MKQLNFGYLIAQEDKVSKITKETFKKPLEILDSSTKFFMKLMDFVYQIHENTKDEMLKNYCKCILILDNSPFYFESGGQIGDKGFLIGNNFIFFVENVKNVNGFYIHYGFLKFGYIIIGDYIKSCVDFNFRKRCSINHSSTHIINYVLKVILSENVKQLGSYIDDCKLRFDFLYNYSLNIKVFNKN